MEKHVKIFKNCIISILVLFFIGIELQSQEATIPFGSWATTQTFNSATANEVTIALGGGAALSSKKPCQEVAKANVPSISSSNTYYLTGYVPDATGSTIDHITFHVSGNSEGTTSYTNYVYYCTEATFNITNVLGFTAFTFTGYDQTCTDHTVTFPAGVKSFRIYRAAKVTGASAPYIVESGTTQGDSQTMNFHDISVWLNSGTPLPAISASPTSITGLYYNTADAIDNTGGNPSSSQFTVTGSNLTDTEALTVKAPTNFQVSLTGTGGWGASVNISPSGGAISKTIYVRIDPSYTSYGTVSDNVTFSQSEVASITPVSLSGEVVNLTPLPCPGTMTVSNETFAGADFTWTNVANNNGYLVKIYKSGVQVGSTVDLPANSTNYAITGLNELTTYTARLTVKGNGSSSGNSAECVAQTFTTLVAPPTGKTVCWTEDFETLAPSENTNSDACPASGATTNELRYSTSYFGTTNRCDTGPFSLNLASGLWSNANGLAALGEGHGGSSRSLYVHRTLGEITFPTLDNPKTITMYVYAKQLITNTARGMILYLDGAPITTGIYIDDAAYSTISAVFPGTDGIIRFPSVGWHKLSVEVSSTTQNTLRLKGGAAGDSSEDIYLDDVTIECSSMLLEAAPNVAGLNYVVDMGPSSTRTFTVTGTDLPMASGNVTISNFGSFELSIDNGATWKTTNLSIPYTNYSFAQSVMVRLKAGLGVNSYSTTLAFACAGYTKILPTLDLSGKVTLLPQTLPCGEEVVALNMKGTNESTILLDAVTGTNWTATAQTKNNHFLLSDGTSLVSPTISLDEYDLRELTFTFQPKNATSMKVSLSCFGSGGSFTPVIYNGSQKVPYSITQDLSGTGFSGNFYLQITDGTETDIELWDIMLTVVPKKQISVSTPTLSGFQSYSVDCPSEPQSFIVLGTCLDDNSSIDLTSSYFEFSTDGVTWATPDANNISSLAYTGAYPLGGMKVYVRQKGTAAATEFTTNEVVNITNAGVGTASILLSGTVSPPSAMQVPASVSFSSMSGVASIRSISIEGGLSCNPLVITHNCGTGLKLSNCEGGTYAASTTFAVTDTIRDIYLQYTPGADLNCTLTLTSGSYVTTIPITWTGSTNITNGVATDNTDVTYTAADGYGTTNVWKAGALSDATTVTITSANFEVSMGNPDYSDFVVLTTAQLGDLNGTLYIRQKTAATSGTITLVTAGGQTTTINVTVN